MVRIRLRRSGSKRQPHYRIVVANQRNKRDGRYIEIVGYYNPRTQPETVEYKEDRVLYWLSVGAQPSDGVDKFFERNGTMDRLARLRAGEEMAALVAEAEAAKIERGEISTKTRYEAANKPQPEPVAEIVDEVAAEVEVEEEAAEEAVAGEE